MALFGTSTKNTANIIRTDNSWSLVSNIDFGEIEDTFSAIEAVKPATKGY